MKTKNFICVSLALVCILSLFVGCGAVGEQNKLVGRWTDDTNYILVNFNEDHTFYLRGPDEAVSGTYEVSDNIVQLNYNDGSYFELRYEFNGNNILILEDGNSEYFERYTLLKE